MRVWARGSERVCICRAMSCELERATKFAPTRGDVGEVRKTTPQVDELHKLSASTALHSHERGLVFTW